MFLELTKKNTSEKEKSGNNCTVDTPPLSSVLFVLAFTTLSSCYWAIVLSAAKIFYSCSCMFGETHCEVEDQRMSSLNFFKNSFLGISEIDGKQIYMKRVSLQMHQNNC